MRNAQGINWLRLGSLGVAGILAVSCAGTSAGGNLARSLGADPLLQAEEEPPSSSAQPPSGTPAPSAPATDLPAPETNVPESGVSASAPQEPPTSSDEAQPPTTDVGTDAGEVPADLQIYLDDLIAAEVLPLSTDQDSGFQPNQPINRGTYARWLLAANNQFYADRPPLKVRTTTATQAPIFTDVPRDHPDFEAVQSLAEAGLIPSPLTGNPTATTFRPDDPLQRQDLLLWKVPLDQRSALPTATANRIAQDWGFQDADKIAASAQAAVLADHQLGEFSNILRAFGYTLLFQPQKPVTQAEAAATLWRFGPVDSGVTASDLIPNSDRPDNAPEVNLDAEVNTDTITPARPDQAPADGGSAE